MSDQHQALKEEILRMLPCERQAERTEALHEKIDTMRTNCLPTITHHVEKLDTDMEWVKWALRAIMLASGMVAGAGGIATAGYFIVRYFMSV